MHPANLPPWSETSSSSSSSLPFLLPLLPFPGPFASSCCRAHVLCSSYIFSVTHLHKSRLLPVSFVVGEQKSTRSKRNHASWHQLSPLPPLLPFLFPFPRDRMINPEGVCSFLAFVNAAALYPLFKRGSTKEDKTTPPPRFCPLSFPRSLPFCHPAVLRDETSLRALYSPPTLVDLEASFFFFVGRRGRCPSPFLALLFPAPLPYAFPRSLPLCILACFVAAPASGERQVFPGGSRE